MHSYVKSIYIIIYRLNHVERFDYQWTYHLHLIDV